MKHLPLMLLLFAGCLHAAVYKQVNENGEVVYSDKPAAGAKKMDLPELPTYTPPPVPLVRPADAPVESEIYEGLEVIKPANDSTIRNNLGIIEVQLRIEPALKVREKHRLQLYLDNERYGPLVDKTAIMMSNIERGEHTLSASVFDGDGNVVAASNSVTVFVKRESELHKKDRFVPPPEDPDNPPPETPVNPGNREFNPNIRTENPNIRTPNPNIISPPPAATPLPSAR
jgi:hypothetical protein